MNEKLQSLGISVNKTSAWIYAQTQVFQKTLQPHDIDIET